MNKGNVSVKGFATIDNVTLISIEVCAAGGRGTGQRSALACGAVRHPTPGLRHPPSSQGTGLVGVPGIASAIFSTVRDANINVIMISQVRAGYTRARPLKGRCM